MQTQAFDISRIEQNEETKGHFNVVKHTKKEQSNHQAQTLVIINRSAFVPRLFMSMASCTLAADLSSSVSTIDTGVKPPERYKVRV